MVAKWCNFLQEFRPDVLKNSRAQWPRREEPTQPPKLTVYDGGTQEDGN
jgi:hypothetical protein